MTHVNDRTCQSKMGTDLVNFGKITGPVKARHFLSILGHWVHMQYETPLDLVQALTFRDRI